MVVKDPKITSAGLPLLRLRYQYTSDADVEEREQLEHRFDWYNKLSCLDPACGFHARPKQHPPDAAWFVWMIRTGRKWGKTRTAAEYVIEQAQFGNKRWIGLISDTAADVRDIMVEGESGILTISPPWFRPNYEPSKTRLTWPNGAQASTYSAEDPEQLRGPGHDLVWCDELAKWKHQREAWDMMIFGLTLGDDPHCVVTTTPRPTSLVKELSNRKDVALVRGHTDENLANLADSVIETIIKPYEGTRTGLQELAGDILEDVEGALWTLAEIDEMRISADDVPELSRCVTAIDPSGSNDEGASEQGIVTAGIGLCTCKGGTAELHGFLLADDSGHYTPEGWALRAIGAYDHNDCDRVVAEINYGGAMVESTLRAIDPDLPYRTLTASRGKRGADSCAERAEKDSSRRNVPVAGVSAL